MSKEAKAGRTLEYFKADVHPRMIEGCGPIRGLSQKNNLSKNPVLCGVITVIYQLPIETECTELKTQTLDRAASDVIQ